MKHIWWLLFGYVLRSIAEVDMPNLLRERRERKAKERLERDERERLAYDRQILLYERANAHRKDK